MRIARKPWIVAVGLKAVETSDAISRGAPEMGFDDGRQVAELNQRIRRVLWVFRTVAGHMAVHSGNSDDYALHLSGRIAALARVVLAPVFFDGIDLESLIRDELRAAHPTQLIIRGPEARLAPKEAEMMSLAIHELATNAVKFGALSQSQAKIRIVWDITFQFGVRLLRFGWLEAGVEMAGASSAPGFGSELIERLIARELKGEGKMTFLPDGVHCTIEIPLSGKQDRHG